MVSIRRSSAESGAQRGGQHAAARFEHVGQNPVVAVLIGWLLLSERLTLTIAAGAALILASVAFVVRREA